MKIQFILMTVSVTLLAIGRVALGQCPQICDAGLENTAFGNSALTSNTTGGANTAIGHHALNDNTTGSGNTAVGFQTLLFNNADNNTAVGYDALTNNTTGTSNTAIGLGTLFNNQTGNNNTASGLAALDRNTTGNNNTATGADALFLNTTGFENTATGYFALYNNNGQDNTADGLNALTNNVDGNFNTASGVDSMVNNSSGSDNTATGFFALALNTTGGSNCATGESALVSNTTGSNNTAEGVSALSDNTTGSSNIAVGVSAGSNLTTGNNNIDIGNAGAAGESNRIRIGTKQTHRATFIAGISGATVPTGVPVIIDNNGRLGTTTSSARFKNDIKPMDKASEAILSLQPVSFRYKHEVDPNGIPQFGLVAEQVEKVNPDLVARDDEGKPYTVRYEAVNAMLLNEFLKEHRKVTEQECKVESLEKAMAEQQRVNEAIRVILKEQATVIQQVSAQLAVRRPATQIAFSTP